MPTVLKSEGCVAIITQLCKEFVELNDEVAVIVL